MDTFIQRHQEDIIGVVSGFDRRRLRGTLRSICYVQGLDLFLARVGVRYKDFKEVALGWSERLVAHAQQAGRPFEYVASSNVSVRPTPFLPCRVSASCLQTGCG